MLVSNLHAGGKMMDKRKLGGASAILAVFVMSVLVMGSVPIGALADDEGTRADEVLRIGAQDDTKMINYWGYAHSPDVWTSNVLAPVYEGVGQEDPATEDPVPYLLKGIDADGSGTFDLDEYGVYRREDTGDPEEALKVTAYYDFNGAIFHDGVQVTMDDLLFSYSMSALVPTEISLDSLKDKSGLPGTNFTTSHWLHIWPVVGNWDPQIPVGDISNIFALRFEQVTPYANFVKYTLNGQGVYPRHIWEGSGKLCQEASGGTCTDWKEPLHPDYGIAYDETIHNGVPATDPNSYNMDEAKIWDLSDSEVIGSGAMEFDNWTPGVSAKLSRYEGYKADAQGCEKVGGVCTGNFFSYMHKPYIGGMLFKIYKTAQAAVFALQAGEIEVVSWSVPPEFVGGLLIDPNVGIYNTAEKGFFYLSYNMRKSPFGYPDNDPSQGDDGLWLRKAMAHVIDKKTIVTTLLQNFGAAGDQPVSPSFTKWYNASVTKYDYDLEVARGILDDHYTLGGFALGTGPTGYRNLPNIGDREVQILCPQADYDPIRASACNMIATRAQEVGLNFVSTLMAFGEITERLDDREMDIWVLGWRIGSDPPDYYHAFFYSGNAPQGQNYEGFQNETFDDLITQARAELDPDVQVSLIKECSGLLTDAMPYDVLYFRTNIEAYRSDKFINWTVGSSGSIFGGSFWSRIGIHPPSADALTISPPVMKSAVASASTTSVVATVRDPDGTTIAGATVQMTLTGSGEIGNLSIPGGEFGTTVNGTSNINGQLNAEYIAPTVEAETEVFVSAQALEYQTYPASSVQFSRVKVHPLGTQFLSVLVEPYFFALEEGGSMPIEVMVTDEGGMAVDGALVNLVTMPSGPTLTPASGTTSDGTIGTVMFNAPAELAGDVDSQTFNLIVNVTLAGYLSAQDTKEITVLSPTAGGGGGGTETEVPALDVVATIAVIALVAVSFAVFRGTKRR